MLLRWSWWKRDLGKLYLLTTPLRDLIWDLFSKKKWINEIEIKAGEINSVTLNFRCMISSSTPHHHPFRYTLKWSFFIICWVRNSLKDNNVFQYIINLNFFLFIFMKFCFLIFFLSKPTHMIKTLFHSRNEEKNTSILPQKSVLKSNAGPNSFLS
jgi:hypothetical protein